MPKVFYKETLALMEVPELREIMKSWKIQKAAQTKQGLIQQIYNHRKNQDSSKITFTRCHRYH